MTDESAIQARQQWRAWVIRKPHFYISIGKWDCLTIAELDAWLTNFDDDSIDLALRILDETVYYSDSRVKRLCRHSLTHNLFSRQMRDLEQRSNFGMSDAELKDMWRENLSHTAIVPVLDSLAPSMQDPGQSGHVIVRLYSAIEVCRQEQIVTPTALHARLSSGNFQNVLFVDDFLGSGDQLFIFWTTPQPDADEPSVSRAPADLLSDFPNVDYSFTALVASSDGVDTARRDLPDLYIDACEVLNPEYRVFGADSMYFPDQAQRQQGFEVLTRLASNTGLNALGHNDLDYAVAFHHGAPDATLPILKETSSTWKKLFASRMWCRKK